MELITASGKGAVECIVQGRLELMLSEHCLIGGLLGGEKCCLAPCRTGNFSLVDEKNYEFPLLMDSACRMHLLNSRPLCLLDRVSELFESGVEGLRIETLGMEEEKEKEEEKGERKGAEEGRDKKREGTRKIQALTEAYRKAIDSYMEKGKLRPEKCNDFEEKFTTGHYFRGVE
ncbi:MAG: U32 family peptidase [Methanosarcinaceae archaeon]|nr:U32 family peptidase [Methanosarcinaceae archaeon]